MMGAIITILMAVLVIEVIWETVERNRRDRMTGRKPLDISEVE
ncbi:hypothetical protein CCP3SC15_380008 [Gammaproteobacteria bacterium]